jgi:Tol biopolymer transport system component
MKNKLVDCMILLVFITACSNNTVATSIPPTPVSTNTVTPTETRTPSPTVTVISTSTQFPALSGEPPYLALRQDFYAQEIMIYDHNGGGRRIVELPEDGYLKGLGGLGAAISPDGKWIAFHTEAVPVGGDLENLPVTLYVQNIDNGEIRKIADVVTDGYVQKLREVAEKLKTLYPQRYNPIDGIDWVYGATELEFLYGVYTSSWSPDGKYLAFTGQIDGDSSDVYLYAIDLISIQRLNDDIQNVTSFRWAPDSNYLLLYNSLPGYIYPGVTLHYLKIGNEIIKDTPPDWSNTWGGVVDWLSPNLILMTGGTDTAGSTDLQVLNMTTHGSQQYWEGLYGNVVVDHINKVMAVSTSDYQIPENPGLYLVDFDGNKKLILNGYYYRLVFRGGEKHRFLAAKYSLQEGASLQAIALDGTSASLRYIENFEASISPDGSWLLIFNDREADLYNQNDEMVKSFPIAGMYEVKWKPNSDGVFYSTGKELYYLPMPDGESLLIDQCLLDDCIFSLDEYDSAWLP